MMLANELSYKQKMLNKTERDFLNDLCPDLLDKTILHCLKSINLDSIINFIQKDKKTIGERIYFVLIKTAGETCFEKFKLDKKLLSAIQAAVIAIIQV